MLPWHMLYGLDAPFAAPDLADRGQAPLLALRMLVLLTAALRLAATPRRAAGIRFVVVAVLIVVSLLAKVAFVPAAACASLVLASWPDASGRGWKRALGPCLACLLAFVAAPWLAARGGEGVDADQTADAATMTPPRATARALERGNLYEARFWAEQWARLEQADPRQGTLILARVEHQVGHDARARAIASDVAARASSPSIRAQAQATLASLGGPP